MNLVIIDPLKANRVYPEEGSWSRSLRPDYTLSMWPSEFSKKEAEIQELIVHIHFDAKYKIDKIYEIIGRQGRGFRFEENKNPTYKRADLLKIHAYKDAIRQNGGSLCALSRCNI